MDLAGQRNPDFDAAQDAIRICVAVSRAAFSGYICGEIQVSVRELEDEERRQEKFRSTG
jgi:hypothetical protein